MADEVNQYLQKLANLQAEGKMEEFEEVRAELLEFVFQSYRPERQKAMRQFQWRKIEPVIRRIRKNPQVFREELNGMAVSSFLELNEKV